MGAPVKFIILILLAETAWLHVEAAQTESALRVAGQTTGIATNKRVLQLFGHS